MRIHEVPLFDLLPGLRAWSRLPSEARLAWCQGSGHRNTPRGAYGESERAMLRDGLLEKTATGLRRIPVAARGLRTVLRAAERCRILDPDVDDYVSAEAALRGSIRDYVLATFVPGERLALLADYRLRHWDLASILVERVTSRLWVQPLLDADTWRAWERERMSADWGTPDTWTPLLDPAVQRALGQIVDEIAKAGGTLPLLALLESKSKAEARRRAIAVQAGLRYLVLFPTLLGETEPSFAVGLAPTVSAHLSHDDHPAPQVLPVETETTPRYLVSDLTTLLLDAARGDLRVKADGYELYVKNEKRLVEALLPLPPLVEYLGGTDELFRLHLALTHAGGLNFLEQRVDASGRRVLHLSEDGRAWLSGDAKSRLRHLLDHVSGARQEADDDHPHAWSFPAARRLVPILGGYYRDLEGFTDREVLDAIHAAIDRIPTDGAVSLGDWIRHEIHDANLLLGAEHVSELQSRRRGNSWVSPEELERAWTDILSCVVSTRLIPLGGLAIADPPHGSEEPLVSLTDVGRYLIGRVDDFELEGSGSAGAKILVQPNFDIVFMSPAPGTEALLVEFAERTGHQVGTLFHLTRKAAMRAAGAGLTVETAIERLEEAHGGQIPENVERSLRDWFGRVRVAQVALVQVVRCPDDATAARVEAAGGNTPCASDRAPSRSRVPPCSSASRRSWPRRGSSSNAGAQRRRRGGHAADRSAAGAVGSGHGRTVSVRCQTPFGRFVGECKAGVGVVKTASDSVRTTRGWGRGRGHRGGRGPTRG